MRNGKRQKKPWTKTDERLLCRYSKMGTRVTTVSREMRRTMGALRQKAFQLGIPLGHRNRAS